MSGKYKIGSPAGKGDSKPPRYLSVAIVCIGIFTLWSTLPKAEFSEEAALMPNEMLMEKISQLVSLTENSELKFTKKDKQLAQFGKKLFFDPRLSSNGNISCATCHVPASSFADPKPLSVGIERLNRNAPALINLADSNWFYWDGRTDSLASQSLHPLFNKKEMGLTFNTLTTLIKKYHKDDYEKLFGKLPGKTYQTSLDSKSSLTKTNKMSIEVSAYALATLSSFDTLDKILVESQKVRRAPASILGEYAANRTLNSEVVLQPNETNSLTKTVETPRPVEQVALNIALAFEAYQLGLVAKESAFDTFLNKLVETRDVSASLSTEFSETELTGLKVFIGQGQCILCHNGNNFTNQGFHNIGLPANELVDAIELPVGRAQGVLDIKGSRYNCNSRQLKKLRKKWPIATRKNSACDELPYLSTENLELVGAFKTPTLRNIALTGPYMHDGRFATLEEVIDHYDQADSKPAMGHREESIQPLNLSRNRKAALIKFLESLTSEVVDLSN